MPIFRLSAQLAFPPPELAEADGLLAVGGDLSPQRLLLAYSLGIFPWYNEGDPILWWSPDPRCILDPRDFHLSRSLARLLRRQSFTVTCNGAFQQVVAACAELRASSGTWLGPDMRQAYGRLHQLGYAHSVECWQGEELVGGIYGVALGRCFFGESMFHRVSGASKVALLALAQRLREGGGELIDCQLPTAHLHSLGARDISRGEFLRRLWRGGVSPQGEPQRSPFFPAGEDIVTEERFE
jgi:leucyl/phenylalanyl-tRNA---protein transferase